MGPGRTDEQLEPFLAAVGRLEAALEALEAALEGGGADAVLEAYEHAQGLYDRSMRDCEADLVAVLAQNSAARLPSVAWLAEKASLENLHASLASPELELLPPEAVSRVARLAEAMLRARHVSCLDTYAQARSRALDTLLSLVGLDSSTSSSVLPAGLSMQSADALQRTVAGWAFQLRVLLLGAAAELALAQDVGKAVCEGRSTARSPDRLFVLLQMHKSLMDLLPYLDDLLSPRERCTGLLNEAHLLGVMMGRAARQLFAEFEEGVGGVVGPGGGSSSSAVSKLTMLDGTVHPICATTLSFLKRLFTYPNALTLLFSPGGSVAGAASGGDAVATAAAASAGSTIMRILMRLLEALEAKAKAYKSPALGHLFLMNNVHYMVWTVEQAAAVDKQLQREKAAVAEAAAATGAAPDDDNSAKRRTGTKRRAATAAAAAAAAAIDGGGATRAAGAGDVPSTADALPSGLGVLGSAWVERHKDIVEHYGAAYHEDTWRPLIAGLEAVIVTEEDKEPSDPGRFKSWLKSKFAKVNGQLDAILKQQATWTIPDSKLKAAVRNVIKQDLVPLYGEFWQRYTAVNFTTHPEKYLRYPPEQLEYLVDHALFEGRATSGPRGASASGGPSLAAMSRSSVAPTPLRVPAGSAGDVVFASPPASSRAAGSMAGSRR
ncbi:hypothetical protein GPECTOR_6g741 [Gonium pectorale]|uniref:Exocyst subunit Exo70 family protein n=1 Tax=Gonium pectorale TaxID=33097 RepID=A0A150GVN8_GONPE|nr:hypothetical protein GPECTOR_6g741 [Gonium pectorale]|eukprot:KXZ53823.1 hypothetical protein GPECTOR_6g741 [Gonium pectorale]